MLVRFDKFYDRFEMEVNSHHFSLTVWIGRPSYRWREFKRAWSNFFGPCPECGKRFGRHDEEVEHLPFLTPLRVYAERSTRGLNRRGGKWTWRGTSAK